jgi:hypothetical protein
MSTVIRLCQRGLDHVQGPADAASLLISSFWTSFRYPLILDKQEQVVT